MTIYAQNTSVSVERTESEIRSMLLKYGATSFASGWANNKAYVVFEAKDRRVRFELTMPVSTDPQFDPAPHSPKASRTEAARKKRCEQEHRARWRALALVIKAKLEAVTSGITSFEDEFLAYIATDAGPTIGKIMAGRLHEIASTSTLPPLLAAGRRPT